MDANMLAVLEFIDGQAVRVQIFQRIYFAFDSDKILTISFPVLDAVSQVLSEHPELLTLEVQGHTDSMGSIEYNDDLSKRRAKSVVAYLIDSGIDKNRLRAAGFGERVPLITNETASGRARNRRVEFIIIHQK